ncbi:MAG: tetratricopeptide repeat protein [Betaproteobacteria bacterium]|nr:tetratricopeptide repeat protein [Betaproteobacteria bacterium]
MPDINPTTLRFEDFALDPARCSLQRGDREIRLRPKAFDVLRYLAENPGRLVSKDELMKTVWAGVVVTDDSLVQCVKDIRDALNDSEQRIIKTVPRRGYLFAAEVSSGVMPGEHAKPTADERRSPWRRKKLWLASTLALIALTLLIGPQLIDDSTAPGSTDADRNSANGRFQTAVQRQSIAVLPLVSLSDAPEDYFADGLTEDIISALGRFPDISVRSRSAVLPYKDQAPRPDEVGRDLDVRYVLEGSVRRSAERIRVSVRLIDASRGAVLWSQQYDTEPRDVFAVQDDITRRIAGTLAVRLSDVELAKAAAKPPGSLEAYDLVLRGRDLLSRATRMSNSQARSMFERASALDPNYVPAIVGLGLVDLNAVRFGWTADPLEALQRAERLGHKAIAIDEYSPGAHALLGRVYIRRGDLDRALDEMKRSLELNPSDPDVHAGLGNVLLLLGDVGAAIKAIETAVQLHPGISPTDYFRLGMAYMLAGRNTDAIRALERALVRDESNVFINALLAGAYAETERQEDAARQAGRVRQLSPIFAAAEIGTLFRNPSHREKILTAMQKAGL